MCWFDKNNPMATFMDIRELDTELCDGRPLVVKPDVQADFRSMPFDDGHFDVVLFDPPHMNKLGKDSWMAQKYGVILNTWETDLQQGFEECFRVLKSGGVLVFKWNEMQITLNQVLKLAPQDPVFGHTSGKHGRTKWMVFIK